MNELATLGNNPNVRVLGRLHDGALRFSELLDNDSPAAESALNDSLQDLDRAGLVVRHVDSGPPLRVLYSLTNAGAQLTPALESLAEWAKESGPATAKDGEPV
jgi:DNA-binding HxlR family transcriptional regulator